jgi:hypothetical protein
MGELLIFGWKIEISGLSGRKNAPLQNEKFAAALDAKKAVMRPPGLICADHFKPPPHACRGSVAPVAILPQQPILAQALRFVQISAYAGKNLPLLGAIGVSEPRLPILAAKRAVNFLAGQ